MTSKKKKQPTPRILRGLMLPLDEGTLVSESVSEDAVGYRKQ